MTKPSLISVVLPVYNQADHVELVVNEYEEVLGRMPARHELLLVVNGSTDRSLEICRELENAFEPVRALHSEKSGWGRAVRLGLEEARGDLLCYTNLARTRPEELALLLLYATVEPDVVIKANRKIRDSAMRRIGSLLYNLECRAFFDLSYWDVNGTPKVFPRAFGRLLELERDDDLIDAEFNVICRREDYPMLEVPTFSNRRHGGTSTTNYWSAIKLYWGVYELWRNTRRGSAGFMKELDAMWAHHHAEWRDTAQIASQWEEARHVDPTLLRQRTRGEFWDVLDEAKATLFVTREYEHLVMALSVLRGSPTVTFMRLPHPSGLAYDRTRKRLHIASTRTRTKCSSSAQSPARANELKSRSYP